MNKIHEWVNTGLIVLVAILVLVSSGNTNQNPSQNPNPRTFSGTTNYDTLAIDDLIVSATSTFSSGNIFLDDIGLRSDRITMTQATTTVCALRNPLGATSTLAFFDIAFQVASTSAAVRIDVAKATTPVATTTNLAQYALGSNTAGYFSLDLPATTTAADSNTIFGPNDWLVVGIRGADREPTAITYPTGLVPEGACSVGFRDLI